MRAVVVTGAGSGIGKATALEFAKNSYFVFLVGRNLEKLLQTQGEIQKLGGEAEPIACDLTQEAEVQKLLQKIGGHVNGHVVHVLVNNAGAYNPKLFAQESLQSWELMFEANLKSALRITLPLFKKFCDQKKGSVVNVASTLGLRPTANTGAYSAAKAAMINWTQSLALEGGVAGVRVNCVCPGIVDTPIHEFHSLSGEEKDKALKSMAHLQPLQRIGTSQEVAQAVYFLGSDLSSWTTGSVLVIDGGINLT